MRNSEKDSTSVSINDKYLPKYLAWEWPVTSTGKEAMISMYNKIRKKNLHQMNIYKYTVINLALKSKDEKILYYAQDN